MKELYNDSVNMVEIAEATWDTFAIYVKVNNFSGKHNFCIEDNRLYKNIRDLEELSRNLYGEYTIEDMDSDSYLKVTMQKYGKLEFSGRLGGTHNNNYIVFDFIADQTLLQKLTAFLKSI